MPSGNEHVSTSLLCFHSHIPVRRWMQSEGGAACAGCPLCLQNTRRPADEELPETRRRWRW